MQNGGRGRWNKSGLPTLSLLLAAPIIRKSNQMT